jgi:riboflavin kinase/FMN adenylyltransferase
MPAVHAGSLSYASVAPPGAVVTIGNFDGVHRGHLHLIGAAVADARQRGAPSCVYTFEPAPRVVLAPQQHIPRVMSWPDKVRLLGEVGVDHIVVERFSRAFSLHPPEWFAAEVLGRRLRPSAMVVGYDFRYGRGRAGGVEQLRLALPGVQISQVSALFDEGEVISSTAVRAAVAEGRVERAAVLLGRPHVIQGTVVQGDQLGRRIGFPTANVEPDSQLLPAHGVYALRVRVDGFGPWLPAVANLGVRPTVEGERYRLEAHLLDYSGDLYGRGLELRFVARLREERRFNGLDELIAQIGRDAAQARELLAGEGSPSAHAGC